MVKSQTAHALPAATNNRRVSFIAPYYSRRQTNWVRNLEARLKMKCTACGSASLVEGPIRDAMGEGVRFYPSDLPSLKVAFGIGYREVRAYGCIHCQNLQLSVDFKEKD